MLSPESSRAKDPPCNCNIILLLASLLLLSFLLIAPVHAQSADISITKDVSPDSPVTGQNVTWIVEVLNNGPDSATNVTVVDDLSEQLNVTIWNVGTLAPGVMKEVTYNTKFSTYGIKWNNVSVTSDATDPDPSDNVFNLSLEILRPDVDLVIIKNHNPSIADIGQEIQWTVQVFNMGPDNTTGVTVIEDMSGLSGKTILSNTTTQGTFSVIGDTGTWDIGSLDAGQYAILTLNTTFSTPGIKVNNVTVSSPDANDTYPNNDFSTDEVVILPPDADLAVSKTASPDSAIVGEEVEWTVTIENLGPDTAINITVIDDLRGIGPSTIAAYSASQGIFSIGFPGLIWDVGSLGAGQNATFTFFSYPYSPGVRTNNVSIIAPDVNDTNTANDAYSVSITVQSPPPPTTRKRDGGGGQKYVEFTETGPIHTSNDAQVLVETRMYAADGILKITLPKGIRVAGSGGEPIDFITITRLPTNETPGLGDERNMTFSGYAYNCTPSGALFEYPVTITFTFDVETWDTLRGRDLEIRWWNEAAGSWEPLTTIIDDSARTVSAEVSHFTIFAVFVRAAAPQETGVAATPTTEVPEVADKEPEVPSPTPTPAAALTAAPLLALAALGYLRGRKR